MKRGTLVYSGSVKFRSLFRDVCAFSMCVLKQCCFVARLVWGLSCLKKQKKKKKKKKIQSQNVCRVVIRRMMSLFRLVLLVSLTLCVAQQLDLDQQVQSFDNVVFLGVSTSTGCRVNECTSLENQLLKELSCDDCLSLDFDRIFDSLVPTDAEEVYTRMLPPLPNEPVLQYYNEVYSELRRHSVARDIAARIPAKSLNLEQEIVALKRLLVITTKRTRAGDADWDVCFGVDWFPGWGVFRSVSPDVQNICFSNVASYRKLDDARTRLFHTLMWQNGILRRILAVCPLCRLIVVTFVWGFLALFSFLCC
jgi:hypothetical protein